MNGHCQTFLVVGCSRQTHIIWYPKIELDQLEKKLRETHRKIFGIVQSYAIGHCQTFLVVEYARQTLHIDPTPQIELD